MAQTILVFSKSVTRVDSLRSFSQRTSLRYNAKKAQAVQWANQNRMPVKFEQNGSVYELQYIDEYGLPQYYKTFNAIAAITISTNKLYPGGTAGLNLTGAGITVSEWDEGNILHTHQEFGSRITNVDGTTTSAHSTHVAGTIMAAGVIPGARGMAYQASLRSYNWNNDLSELASEGAAGRLISNHSYGYTRGWNDGTWYGNASISTEEDYLFGFYDYWARQWDIVAHNAPYFLICKSAGNDRGDSGSGYPPDGPYDCIGQQGVAKNILTVGAVYDIPGGYTSPADVVMSSFSSWGPADDGRIKPDLVANGIGLYSPINSGNTNYASYSGTSMATPSVAGSLALLQQHRFNLTGSYLLSATLKALVIHTADEAGPDPGPDYMFGWGLMNTFQAARLISQDVAADVIRERTLNNGESFSFDVVANGAEPLKMTLVWNDPPGTPPQESLDPITPMLVNDLDLRLTLSSVTYYPWKLDRDQPELAATQSSENNVDNVEVVFIASPVAGGNYTVTIDHDGTLSGGFQNYALIITGVITEAPPVADFTSDVTNPETVTQVNFTDHSMNVPTWWNWTFSPATVTYLNGTTSSSQHPQVAFNEDGTYSVTLQVTNPYGDDQIVKTDYIHAFDCSSLTLPYTEEFGHNGTIPPCWTVADHQGNGQVWQFNNPGVRTINTSTQANGFAILDSDHYDYGNSQNSDLISPDIDFSNATNIILRFEHYYMHYTGSSATFSYSADGGTSWNNVQSWKANTQNAATFLQDMTAELSGFSQVRFKWNYTGAWGWYWAVDDILITADPIIPPVETLSNTSFGPGNNECIGAWEIITVAGDGYPVELQNGSAVNMVAGYAIYLLHGFRAYPGSNLTALINPGGDFCEPAKGETSVTDAGCLFESIIESPSNSDATVRESDFKTGAPDRQVNIYPNPGSGLFHIVCNRFAPQSDLVVYNPNGTVILRMTIHSGEPDVVDISHAPKGLYFVKVTDRYGSLMKKIGLE